MTFSGKVLIADDEAHIRKFVGLVLRSLGTPEVHEAKNGVEALELFERQAPDLVLLDVNMPVLDGLQALAQIRQKDPDVPVVMLTSVVNRSTVDECSRLGATAYLRKDANRQELTEQLRGIIDTSFTEPPSESP